MNRIHLVGWAAGITVLLVLPLVGLSHSALSLATTAVVYAAVASGLGLVYGQLGLLSMSHVALWCVGSYSAVIAILEWGFGFWEAMAFATVMGTLAGVASALPSFRLRGHHFLITTFLITMLVASIATHWESLTGGNAGLLLVRKPDPLFGIAFETDRAFYYLSAGFLIVLLFFYRAITRSRLGRMFLAIRENQQLAQAAGINIRRQIIIGFGLSGVFAGVGGTLYAHHISQVQPSLFALAASTVLPLFVILGGSRHAWGPTVGAFLVVAIPEFLHLSPLQAQAANGAVLVVAILLMPLGLLGALESQVSRFLARGERERAAAREAARRSNTPARPGEVTK